MAVLKVSDRMIDQIGPIIHATAREAEPPEELLILIKNILENQRSALDYIAVGVVKRHGKASVSEDRIYYPMVTDPQKFAAIFEQAMPGVAQRQPEVRN